MRSNVLRNEEEDDNLPPRIQYIWQSRWARTNMHAKRSGLESVCLQVLKERVTLDLPSLKNILIDTLGPVRSSHLYEQSLVGPDNRPLLRVDPSTVLI